MKLFVNQSESLSLEDFKQMDYYVVKEYALPIELMMENAGLNLARVIADRFPKVATNKKIHFGIGPGNNGGGGLVAARRLAAWGYKVSLDFFTNKKNSLVEKQLDRALKFGVEEKDFESAEIIVDAYLGFSQKSPLGEKLTWNINKYNNSSSLRISLDLPTGYFENEKNELFFDADIVLTLAAPKKIFFEKSLVKTKVYIADLGIPKVVYEKFQTKFDLEFDKSTIIELMRK